ncbi:FAD-dependent oxidoreductase [Chloroflexota bacterium]
MLKLARLFDPGRIGNMELKNRLVMAATASTGGDEGYPSERMKHFYVARARGGVGLIISGAHSISPETVVDRAGLNAYDDKFIPHLSKLVAAMQDCGVKVAAQLVHQGPALASFWHSNFAVGPSPVAVFAREEMNPVPREASKEDIKRIIADFSEAARRVKEAGYDAIELNGAVSYLLSAFGSPFTNKRTDEYGGSPEKRARFACEVIAGVRKTVGPDFPIILLMAGCDFVGEEGLTSEEAAYRAPLFAEAGASALRVREGFSYTGYPLLDIPGFAIPAAAAVKKAVDVPVMVGGTIDPVMGEQVLAEGKSDFIAICRALLADPDLPDKVREGRFDEVRPCIGFACFECSTRRADEKFIHCVVNAAVGHEAELAYEATKSPKRVMVVGGGVAGMEAARVLAERGHRVSLYEKSDMLGGQWNVAALEPGKEGYSAFTDYLSLSLERLGVRVFLNRSVTIEMMREANPDAVVVATGAQPFIPGISGIKGKNVVLARDVITAKASVGATAAVIGARLMGIEVALILVEGGKNISLIDQYEIARDVLLGKVVPKVRRLEEAGTRMLSFARVVEVKEGGVVIDKEGKTEFIPAETVVLAAGMKPVNSLVAELEGVVSEVYSIGDCVEPRRGLDAVYEALSTARLI